MKFYRLIVPVVAGALAMSVAVAAPKAKKARKKMAVAAAQAAPATRYAYDTVPGDPFHTRLYTLPNGLRLMLSVNPRAPRIQTEIAVRVGGKNDPAETTGLAHYFEHMMFKGTKNFGTVNYAKEKPMLDEVERLFEIYRQTTDSVARAALYHTIDSISFEASKLAIPNEYDKMMAAMGADGTNAYTSTDMTCYVEDIPSNEIERWAMVQADRFKNPVLRGFHTELETIYEEKNMSLTKDGRKSWEKMLQTLFPSHPYGTQTVLGTQTHLKNPSVTNIKEYHKNWYVPNNMMIAMAGDFNPDEAVEIITRYFGDMKPNPNLKYLDIKPEKPFTSPVREEVWGLDAENIQLAWRAPKAADADILPLSMVGAILNNGSAGLIDLNLNQAQKVLGAGAGLNSMTDHSVFVMSGRPREGQTLAEVETLLLGELDKVRRGDFSNELFEAVKTNEKLGLEQAVLSNSNRVNYYEAAFIQGQPWAEAVADLDRLDKITKADLVRVANKYLGSQNYAAIAKRQGQPKDELKIAKAKLTPLMTNRDTSSTFLRDIVSRHTTPIEPKFVDFAKELRTTSLANGCELFYTHNPYNRLFSLTFVYETGSLAERYLGYAASYLNLIGTPDMTAAQVREAFYQLACEYRVQVGARRSYITISGLSSNMVKALTLFENLVNKAVANPEVYNQFVATNLKSRKDAKANQQRNFSALRTYMHYGPDYIKERTIGEEELRSLNPEKLIASLRDMLTLKHRVIYYGPLTEKQVVADLDANHVKNVALRTPEPIEYINPRLTTDETIIYVAPYDAKQLYMSMFSNDGKTFDPTIAPEVAMYNEYFGGSMNSIVFQEMREARSLAYSAGAYFSQPSNTHTPYIYGTQIATQNDKMMTAVDAFLDIINNIPQSEAAFNLAKDGIEKRLRTARTLDDQIAWAYIAAEDLGIAPTATSPGLDLDRQLFEALPSMTLADVVKLQQQQIKGRTYHYAILGKIEDLDLDALRRLGRVVILTPEQTFGY